MTIHIIQHDDYQKRSVMAEIKGTIIEFIRENFIMGRSDTKLDPDESLIESGVMDSTGVLELVEFLETTYDIQIDDEELIPENLETLNNIVGYLKTKGVQ
ncbi:MAG: acyl carrier protein [Thermodesulfobacteriota bacterium]|nr:acyl carrier protein [Thermodesulfobacteriota bacterium]